MRAAALFALLAGCSPPVLVVEVDGVPPAATTLVPVTALAGVAAAERPRIDAGAARPLSFGLRLPADADGKALDLAVGAFDQDHCLVAVGATTATVAGGARATVTLDPVDGCAVGGAPQDIPGIVLLAAAPASVKSSGGDTVTLRGFGFAPGATVTISSPDGRQHADAAASALTGTTLAFRAPALPVVGSVRVTVTNPGAVTAARDDLLAYAPSTIHFQQASVPVLASSASSLAVGDLDGDGAPDLVATNYDSVNFNVQVVLNDGNGNFPSAPSATYQVAGPPVDVALADFDGDGTLDVAVVCQADMANGALSILHGEKATPGKLTVGAPQTLGMGSSSVAAADLNVDGTPDLALITDSGLQVWLNHDGKLAQAGAGYPADLTPYGVQPGDFDGDGRPDLAVTTRYGGTTAGNVRIFHNHSTNGDGAFFPNSESYDVGGDNPIDMRVGDLDGDGDLDIVVANITDGAGYVLVGRGDGLFDKATPLPIGSYVAGVALADVEGVGHPAALFTNVETKSNADGVAMVHLAGGAPALFQRSAVVMGSGPAWIVAADFDRDGRVDFAVADHNDAALSVWRNDSK